MAIGAKLYAECQALKVQGISGTGLPLYLYGLGDFLAVNLS